jgi:energy-coupling factor transporter ATP-binding protein EcfA2
MSLPLKSIAIGGYRSFREPQLFERLGKVNIFIGQNNSGKSNILRFITEVMSHRPEQGRLTLDPLAYHLPSRPPMIYGISDGFLPISSGGATLPDDDPHVTHAPPPHRGLLANLIGGVFKAKAALDDTKDCWTFRTVLDDQLVLPEPWRSAVGGLNDNALYTAWNLITGQTGGSRAQHWEPETISRISAQRPSVDAVLVPAIRRIGERGSSSDGFDGLGIIDRLAKLQNPDVLSQQDRERFKQVTQFMREVLSSFDANIEIPYDRDTVLLHMNGKVLPVESLGSGIHEILILAAAATVITDKVVCIEEPELHLNPLLQKKLLRYLQKNTSNQYFITTHSAALMDTPEAEVYHVRLVDGASKIERATSDSHRSDVCADLGYHPSDLLQANCVVWVEGPSDRLYINWWLRSLDQSLVEGIHYSVMFYGGRLAAHLSNAPESDVAEFISLRRLNRRGVMIIDSDRASSHAPINATKKRLQLEFDGGPGHAWITAGREIENYLPGNQLEAAIKAAVPSSTVLGSFSRYENTLQIRRARGIEVQAPKVDVARRIVATFTPDFDRLDLRDQMQRLHKFILQANPISHASAG